MFEKFTERARKVMSLSRHEAQRLNQEFIGTEHVLLGIAQEGGGVAAKVLALLGIGLPRIRAEVEKLVAPNPEPPKYAGQIPFSPRCKRVIELSGEAASQLGQDCVGTEHLLIGLIKENEGIGAQVLHGSLGLRLDTVVAKVKEVTKSERTYDNETVKPEDVNAPVRYGHKDGTKFRTPQGFYLTLAELMVLVENKVVKPEDVRALIWDGSKP
jgi:ATP-dependent Clp protease ATP-binding subunit ClpC